jgi:hypothetical protein
MILPRTSKKQEIFDVHWQKMRSWLVQSGLVIKHWFVRCGRVIKQRIKRLEVNALLTTFATIGMSVVAYLQWTTLEKTDATMRSQLMAMYNDQRPWLSVDPLITSNLRYDDNGLNLTVDLRLRNPGKTPALGVQSFAQLTFLHKERDLLQLQDDLCKQASADSRLVFPGNDPVSAPFGFSGGKNEVAKARAASDLMDTLIHPMITGCVRYIFPGDNSRHLTAFQYHLMHMPPFGILQPRSGDMDRAQLLLVQDPFFDNWAN